MTPAGRSRHSNPRVAQPRRPPIILGWREWVGLPELGVPAIKAKLDTGARVSSLHVESVEPFSRGGQEWVAFDVVADQGRGARVIRAEAPVHGERVVRSSGGHEDLRIVVRTILEIAGWQWPIDVTLAGRATMSFRMLIGRQGLSGHALVDSSHSYLAGRPDRERRKS